MAQAPRPVFLLLGVGAVLFVALLFGAVWFLTPELGPDNQFGSVGAVRDLDLLYSRIEHSPHDAALGIGNDKIGERKTRRLPRSWMPPRFAIWGSHDGETGGIFTSGEVVALYDANDSLVAIEFLGRRSYYVSRNATLLPQGYKTQRRLAEKPIFVTALAY